MTTPLNIMRALIITTKDLMFFISLIIRTQVLVKHIILRVRLEEKEGKKYLLLLDQDTVISDSYCSDLLSLDETYSLIVPKLVHNDIIISPCKYMLGRASSLEQNECSRGIKSIKHRNFLNSGSLISIGLFDKVGGFDESLPLYFSDFNFFNRVRKYENYYYQLDKKQ